MTEDTRHWPLENTHTLSLTHTFSPTPLSLTHTHSLSKLEEVTPYLRVRKHYRRGERTVSQRTRKSAARQYLLDTIGILCTHEIYTKVAQWHQMTCHCGWGKSHKAPLLNEELQVINGLWEGGNRLSPGTSPLDKVVNPKWPALNTRTFEQFEQQ